MFGLSVKYVSKRCKNSLISCTKLLQDLFGELRINIPTLLKHKLILVGGNNFVHSLLQACNNLQHTETSTAVAHFDNG